MVLNMAKNFVGSLSTNGLVGTPLCVDLVLGRPIAMFDYQTACHICQTERKGQIQRDAVFKVSGCLMSQHLYSVGFCRSVCSHPDVEHETLKKHHNNSGRFYTCMYIVHIMDIPRIHTPCISAAQPQNMDTQ